MSESFEIRPIGWVRCNRHEAIDDGWDDVATTIELDRTQFGPEALLGLDDFAYAEVLFVFDKVGEDEIETGARHPRGRQDWPKVGIFAQRGKNRPNRIGATICRIVVVSGIRIQVMGLDAIDCTPVIDIKPVMSGFLPRGDVAEPAWARGIMRDYW